MSDRAAGVEAPAPLLRALVTVFAPFAGGYFLSYVFRNVTAIIAPRLIDDFTLDASDLGLLTAAYFFAFAAFQLPLGLLLDRFGPRRVQAALLLSAGLGALVFALAEGKGGLLIGRALIGLGVAGGLMSSIKAITLWFPKPRWPLVKGCFLAIGGLGAIAATAPVEEILRELTDWRGLFLGLSAATLLVSALIFAVVPESGTGMARSGLRAALAGLRQVYADAFFWRLAPACALCSGTSMAVLGLWSGPWLRDVAGFEGERIAATLLAAAASLAAGSVAAGVTADLLGRLGVGLRQVLSVGAAMLLLAQAAIVFELAPQSPWPWVAFGLSSAFMVLAMPLISGHFPLELAGRANTALNLLVFTMAFVAQAAIGWVIDLWPATPEGGYAPQAYAGALGIFLALQAGALLWLVRPARSQPRS